MDEKELEKIKHEQILTQVNKPVLTLEEATECDPVFFNNDAVIPIALVI